MKKYLVLLIPLLFVMAQCHKTSPPDPEPDLPPATQEGRGTIGCYINGKPWWPKPFLTLGPKFLEVSINLLNNSFFLSSIYTEKDKPNQYLDISCDNPKIGINTIFIYPSSSGAVDYFLDYSKTGNCISYFIDTTKIHRITLTKIETTGVGILSGTFEFTAFNTCGDTLRFTQGRFDY